MKTSTSLYESITNKIIESLKEGVLPWHKPWASSNTFLPLRYNGIPYQGINTLLLWIVSSDLGYTSPTWMTFKQAQELGGHVKKGERGTPVCYADTIHKESTNDQGEQEVKHFSFLRSYTVFNVEQIEGLPSQYYIKPTQGFSSDERIASLEAFVSSTGASITEGGDRASYIPSLDIIKMPPFASFDSPECYYATLCHELVHWTGHPSRLDRKITNGFGSKDYAFEELVAELGSAFLAGHLGFTPQIPDNHASYIASWIKALGQDHQMIFRAAGLAQKAVEFLMNS